MEKPANNSENAKRFGASREGGEWTYRGSAASSAEWVEKSSLALPWAATTHLAKSHTKATSFPKRDARSHRCQEMSYHL